MCVCILEGFNKHKLKAKSALADNRKDVCGIISSLFNVTEASEGLQSPWFEDGYINAYC